MFGTRRNSPARPTSPITTVLDGNGRSCSLYGEIGAGEIISVDVEGWDGESKDNTKATFTFSPRPKPLPEGTFDEPLEDTEVRDNDGADAESVDTIVPDTLPEEPVSSSNDDGNNPPPAGAGAPSGQ